MFFTQKKLSRDFLGFILDLREGFKKKPITHWMEGGGVDRPALLVWRSRKDKIVKLD